MVNVTNYFSNVSNIGDMMQIPNYQTGGWFWLGMQFMIFIVLAVVSMGVAGWEVALISSAFISLIVGMFLVYLHLMAWKWLMFFVGLILILIFYTTWNNRKDVY